MRKRGGPLLILLLHFISTFKRMLKTAYFNCEKMVSCVIHCSCNSFWLNWHVSITLVFLKFFLSGIWYYLQVLAIYLSFLSEAPLSTRTPKKACALTSSTSGFYSRFRLGMQTKQEPVDSLIFFNDKVLITDMFVSVLQPNTKFYLI